ncbi:hypothetical protein FH972_009070 [Carpinus fangiana]|uniref:Uncharacterized protein n=1 Tax=Carpinus fangiana TaxID=176857 RepID=A0A5N6R2X9_9ROSI|nr:hypothetical protein FH972_009070 [Carpinus fangiana]
MEVALGPEGTKQHRSSFGSNDLRLRGRTLLQMKLMEPEASSLALRWAGNWDQFHPMAIINVFPRPSIPKAGPLEPKCFPPSAVFSFVCQEHFEPIGERWFSSLSTAERSAFNQVELWAKREYGFIRHGNRFSDAKLRRWKTDTLHFRKSRRVIFEDTSEARPNKAKRVAGNHYEVFGFTHRGSRRAVGAKLLVQASSEVIDDGKDKSPMKLLACADRGRRLGVFGGCRPSRLSQGKAGGRRPSETCRMHEAHVSEKLRLGTKAWVGRDEATRCWALMRRQFACEMEPLPRWAGCRRNPCRDSLQDLVVRPQARLGRDCDMLVAGEGELRLRVMGNLLVTARGEACR